MPRPLPRSQVDITSTQPIEDAFEVLEDSIDRPESLTQ
jgi:hypothetical protein